jgi:hypothetical protein
MCGGSDYERIRDDEVEECQRIPWAQAAESFAS